MLLYLDTRRAPNPRKVRIYLAEKQLDIPIKELDLYAGEQKAPEFLSELFRTTWPTIIYIATPCVLPVCTCAGLVCEKVVGPKPNWPIAC